jgi:hypothetical protein
MAAELAHMVSLVKQIADQAKHDQHRRSKAKKEQVLKEAEAAQAFREAELIEKAVKLEDTYNNEMKALLEDLNEEFAALLAQEEKLEIASKPSKDVEVRQAGDAFSETIGEWQ